MKIQDRIKKLESMMLDPEKGQQAIIFSAVNGRVGSEADTSQIVKYRSNGEEYDIQDGESAETFCKRATQLAKARLSFPGAIPTLYAVSQDMLESE